MQDGIVPNIVALTTKNVLENEGNAKIVPERIETVYGDGDVKKDVGIQQAIDDQTSIVHDIRNLKIKVRIRNPVRMDLLIRMDLELLDGSNDILLI